jgi:hypothetical protein
MANTRRESTAHQRSEDASYLAGPLLVPALGFGPHLSTAIHAIGQATSRVASPLHDPAISLIVGAVDTAFTLHSRTNGSTTSLIHGNMVGFKLYSVSIYPSRSITLWERPTQKTLFDYAKANFDLLLRPDHALGTWFNDRDLLHCLDVVVLIRDRNVALEIGHRFGQLAIYDLEARREISVSCLSQESAEDSAEVCAANRLDGNNA